MKPNTKYLDSNGYEFFMCPFTKMYITQFKTIISDNFNVYGGSEEEETDLKKEFFSPENEMTENETDKELLDWISNLTLEPKVEYGKV